MKNKQTYERSHVKCSAPIFGLDCHISPFLYQIQCHWSLPGNQRLFEKVRQLEHSLESSTKDNTTSNLFTKKTYHFMQLIHFECMYIRKCWGMLDSGSNFQCM